MSYKNLKTGQEIFFSNEVLPMIIKAISERYAICTRKIDKQEDIDLLEHQVEMSAYHSIESAWENQKDEIIYSCLDFQEEKKAPHNLVFNLYDLEDQTSIDELLADLESKKTELSRRNGCDLYIDWDKTNTSN